MTPLSPLILIVEDDWLIAEDLKMTLVNLGYQVVGVATTGEAAIEMAKKTEPDLLLLDVHLDGGMNGFETATEIRKLKQRAIPALFVTGQARETLSNIPEQSFFLAKPWTDVQIRKMLLEIFER